MALLEPNGYGTLGFNGCWFSEQAQLLCTTVFREQINVRKVSQDTFTGTFNQNCCATGVTSDVTVRRCFVVHLTTNHPANAFYYTVQRQQISLQGDFCKLWSDKSCLNRLKDVCVDSLHFLNFTVQLLQHGCCSDLTAFISKLCTSPYFEFIMKKKRFYLSKLIITVRLTYLLFPSVFQVCPECVCSSLTNSIQQPRWWGEVKRIMPWIVFYLFLYLF